jgi:UPF0755 protein
MGYLSARNNKILIASLALLVLVTMISFRPVDSRSVEVKVFEVRPGESFWYIISGLRTAGLIRSSVATGGLAVMRGQVRSLKPGRYELSPAFSSIEILNVLESGSRKEVTVTIPEGASLYEIDELLSNAGVLPSGSLLPFHERLEGFLFPDTYRFFTGASSSEVLRKFSENFELKTDSFLSKDPEERKRLIIIASLIEKEVPGVEDGRVVAGILLKRLKEGMPLQVDATLCYAKLKQAAENHLSFGPCGRISVEDKEIVSLYNTYRHAGLPPGPIGNPSLWAMEAARTAKSSPYWFYISDPITNKTIFARTLGEQNRNIARYLRL